MEGRERRSAHLLDSALWGLVDAFPAADLDADTLPAFRRLSLLSPDPADLSRDVDIARRMIPVGGSREVPLLVYSPRRAAPARPVILHMHGGGFVGGTVAGSQGRNCELAIGLGVVVVSVDYALAPEHPFPAAIEDCYAALSWVVRSGAGIGADPDRVILKGESAGGGLAAALAILARDRGEFRPVFQHLTYPMLDDRTGRDVAADPYAGEFIWTAASNRFGWDALLGPMAHGKTVSPYAAPARETDFSGLPPAYIMTGALDLFAREDIRYAQELIRAGVAVELHVYPGACHGFDAVQSASVSVRARESSWSALARYATAD